MSKVMINIGSEVWVDFESIRVIQPRFTEQGGKIPGCVVFLSGDSAPVEGSDSPFDVIQTMGKVLAEQVN